jgi:hypothetical protein
MKKVLNVSDVRRMSGDDFCELFNMSTVNCQYKNIIKIYYILRVLRPVEYYWERSAKQIISEIRGDIRVSLDWMRARVPERGRHVDEETPGFILCLQYGSTGILRNIGFDCWGVKAVVTAARGDGRGDGLVVMDRDRPSGYYGGRDDGGADWNSWPSAAAAATVAGQ